MTQASRPARIGLFGGTFDPVHHAHLRLALELKRQLALDEMRLVPSFKPTYREALGASAEQRLAMLKLAVEGSGLVVDTRELVRDDFTYTVDSLAQLRESLAPETQVCFCMGADSLQNLASWRRFESLTDYAHLVVVGRPGFGQLDAAVLALLARTSGTLADTFTAPAGRILQLPTRLLEISATDIRQQVAAGESIQYLVPESVREFIDREGLYRTGSR